MGARRRRGHPLQASPPAPAPRRHAAARRVAGPARRPLRPRRRAHARRPAGVLAHRRRQPRDGSPRARDAGQAAADPDAPAGRHVAVRMILGVHMTLLIGPTFAAPAPLPLTEALESVEVTQTDRGRSGFQLTFHVGRSGPWDLPDYRLLLNPLLRPFNRVVVMVRFDLLPTVLIDGFITQLSLAPSEEPGGSKLVVTGEDVSVMMHLEAIAFQWPSVVVGIVTGVLTKYAILGWTGAV